MTLLFAFVRALHYAGVMVLFGAAALQWLAKSCLQVQPALPRILFLHCGAVALGTTVLSLGFVANDVTGTDTAWLDPAIVWQVSEGTLFGQLALARMALLAAYLLCAWLRPAWTLMAGVVLGGGALALPGLTSHAAAAVAAQYEYVLAASDALHLLAGGFWIGGLVALVLSLRATPNDAKGLLALLRLFSTWASVAVAILILAGTANGVAILDTHGRPWSDAYLTWLAIKLVLAALMIALALTNRFGLMPGLAREELEADQTLPLMVFAELACAALILLVVGILGLTAPMQM